MNGRGSKQHVGMDFLFFITNMCGGAMFWEPSFDSNGIVPSVVFFSLLVIHAMTS